MIVCEEAHNSMGVSVASLSMASSGYQSASCANVHASKRPYIPATPKWFDFHVSCKQRSLEQRSFTTENSGAMIKKIGQ